MRAFLFALTLVAAPLMSQAADYRISPNGYGPIHIGMGVRQAARALGRPLRPYGDEIPNGVCYHVEPRGGPAGLSFMVLEHRIARVSVYEGPSPVQTDSGIRIGDPIDAVRRAYGKAANEAPHEYLGPVGRYLTVWDIKRKRGIRFETGIERRVESIHAGGRAITYIEGCS